MFKKILIANRGEIAVRVIRACREMGITAVAVYSEADRDALHVRLADEAYEIGPPAAAESYLSIEKILRAANQSGAEAIHPGYGFLSENPLLPEACEKAGVVFIGPGAEAMRLMGNKVTARRAMIEAGVPVTPGTEILPKDPAEARAIVERTMTAQAAGAQDPGAEGSSRPDAGTGGAGAQSSGDHGTDAKGSGDHVAGADPRLGSSAYPVLLKAAAGGGGKGMRAVRSAAEFDSAFTQARSEALSSFGDPSVYAERLVTRPRHIEVQVLADTKGTIVHLGERECTIQRRHQKLIEESPSPVVDATTRARLGEMAIKAARAAAYVGAGTCEFLRDDDGSYYFMEMNARLQVEHPVTEMVTGLDLVKLQIRIAAGEPIPFKQTDTAPRGWSIECRIFAEDPSRNFMPSPGRIGTLRVPAGPGIRDDGGVYQGYRVPMHYDPMISKLVSWGQTREEAIARMRRALDEYRIEGVRTTIPFHRRVFRHPAFIAGDMDTSFIETYRAELIPTVKKMTEAEAKVAKLAALDPFDTLPPGVTAEDVQAAQRASEAGRGGAGASAGGKTRSTDAPPEFQGRGGAGASGSDGNGLTTRQLAVIAASIAAYRKAETDALDAAFEMTKPDGDGAGRGARMRPARQPGWKLAGRMATLRDR
jgi:acetyl-CoA carboxylase biotin carboxylase subunit